MNQHQDEPESVTLEEILGQPVNTISQAQWNELKNSATVKDFLAKSGCNAPPANGINWSGCDKAGASLEGAHLNGATLINIGLGPTAGHPETVSNLKKADLNGAALIQADVQKADFSGANIRGSLFLGASAQGAKFKGAQMQGTNFSHANLTGADFSGANLEGALFDGATLTDTKFDGATPPSTQVYYCYIQEHSLGIWQRMEHDFLFSKLNDNNIWLTLKTPASKTAYLGNMLGWGTEPTLIDSAGGKIVPGEYSAGAVTFSTGSDQTQYWPNGAQFGEVIQGSIQTTDHPSIQSFKGVLVNVT